MIPTIMLNIDHIICFPNGNLIDGTSIVSGLVQGLIAGAALSVWTALSTSSKKALM